MRIAVTPPAYGGRHERPHDGHRRRSIGRRRRPGAEPPDDGFDNTGAPRAVRVIGQLQVLAERLPQTLDQLAGVLERPALGVEYGVDNGVDPDEVIGDALVALRAAADRAHDLARRLANGQSAVGHLYIARELTAAPRG